MPRKSSEAKRKPDRERIQKKREDEEFRHAENSRRAAQLAQQRVNEDRQVENSRRAAQLAEKRKNEEFRQAENARRATQLAQQRENEDRQLENSRRAAQLAEKRKDDHFRTPERNMETARRNESRQNPARRRLDYDHNSQSKRQRRHTDTSCFDNLLTQYTKCIKEGPTYICSSCGSALYKQSTSATSREMLLKMGRTDEFINKVLCVQQNQHRLCTTCKSYIKKDKIPRVCLSNGLDFPDIPAQLKDLTRLEERLVSPRIPFMQIRLRGYEQQWALHGNVVNVENNLDRCVRALPRQFRDASVVQIKLKRRMCYNGHYIYDKISPRRVVNALQYLLETPLYKKNNVIMSADWNQFGASGDVEFVVDDDDENQVQREITENATTQDEVEELIGADETLLYTESDIESIVTEVAPAEGNIPIPLTLDLDAEVLSFPTIYCGQERVYNNEAKLSVTDIAKSELRRFDRRCAKPEKILFSFKKSFNEKVKSAYNICLAPLTARRILSSEVISNIISKDDGYAVFKNLRSSPAYWKEQTKRVVATVRQLGSCSFFQLLRQNGVN